MQLSNQTIVRSSHRTWQQRLEDASERFASRSHVLEEKRVVFIVDGPSQALEAVIAGLHWELDFGVLDMSRLTPEVVEEMDHLGIARVNLPTGEFAGADVASGRVPGRVSVMTSGTTGVLKPVGHTWQTLNTLARISDQPERSWFVPFQIGSYAWYQMVCLSLFSPRQHLHFATPEDLLGSFSEAISAGITAISSTPTFWRYAFLHLDDDVFRKSKIETISLGGEIVDQGILNRLASTFPGARIRHIYASSEAGAAIVVTDGKAGFPVAVLEEDRERLKVENGKLHVRSPYTTAAASGKADAWVDTGDLVQILDGRVYFAGREGSSLINVGGMKAFPAEIEAQLMEHPNVLWAQVYARHAPLVGSLPAARIVLKQAANDPKEDEVQLAAFAHRLLPEHAVPRSWEFRPEIPIGSSLKS